jgi:hypothetical protein
VPEYFKALHSTFLASCCRNSKDDYDVVVHCSDNPAVSRKPRSPHVLVPCKSFMRNRKNAEPKILPLFSTPKNFFFYFVLSIPVYFSFPAFPFSSLTTWNVGVQNVEEIFCFFSIPTSLLLIPDGKNKGKKKEFWSWKRSCTYVRCDRAIYILPTESENIPLFCTIFLLSHIFLLTHILFLLSEGVVQMSC